MSADASVSLLQDARRGAQRALETLLRQQRELDDASLTGVLSPQRLAEGRQSVGRAVESARRTLERIDAELSEASTST